MVRNVGGYDRIARLVLGSALLVVGVVGVATVDASAGVSTAGPILLVGVTGVLLVVGSALVVTGALQQCPVNERLGIDTGYVERT